MSYAVHVAANSVGYLFSQAEVASSEALQRAKFACMQSQLCGIVGLNGTFFRSDLSATSLLPFSSSLSAFPRSVSPGRFWGKSDCGLPTSIKPYFSS